MSLIYKGKEIGGFPVVDSAVTFDSNNPVSSKAVYAALQNAGVSVDTYIEITMAEYEALSDEEKNNGVPYYITDSVGGGITLATELNSSVTDDQIPSAKAVVDAMDDYLPLTGGTLSGTVTVSKNLASFAAKHNDGAAVYYGTHNNRARIKTQNIAGSDANYRFLDLNNSDRGNVEILQLGDCTDGTVTWYNVLHTGNLSQNGICKTSAKDVSTTTITYSDETYYSKYGNNNYCVQNGICYCSVYPSVVQVYGGWTPVAQLPKSKIELLGSATPVGATVESKPLLYRISTDGELLMGHGDVGKSYVFSFSYPVAE